MTAPELYFHIKKVLDKNNIEDAQFEAMCMTEHIFKEKLARILLDKKDITEAQKNFADNMLVRRLSGVPLQYILGEWEFYGLKFYVGEGVLIPRQDTETLIDKALSLKLNPKPNIVDLCSGSGCIALTLKKNIPQSHVTAVEISENAAGYLRKNAEYHGLDIDLVMGDVLNEKTAQSFQNIDLLICNPPYLTKDDMASLQREVTFEPSLALYGGDDGLTFYKTIIPLWKKALSPGGVMMFEIGLGQEEDIIKIFKQNDFTYTDTQKDLCGKIRLVLGSI